MADNATGKSRVGRPRASRKALEGPVRESIMAAARDLFRDRGFAGTSTREIAAAVGLRQPSLFHYFKGKEAIFEAVAIAAVQPVLDFLATEQQHPQTPEVALYRMVYFDNLHLCTNENALGPLSRFPEMTRSRQPRFWELRDRIIDAYRDTLSTGVQAGSLFVEDLESTTQFLFALGESTLLWFPRENPYSHAQQVARCAAGIALRAVLADPRKFEDVQRAACLQDITLQG